MSTVVNPHEEPARAQPVQTFVAAGELLDTTAIDDIADRVRGTPAAAITVDLSAVTYLSMEAAARLVVLARLCAEEGRSLRVVPSGQARRKLVTMGLDAALPLAP
ncbi:STAS domain-containing protein [Amycolatopsis sp. NPDC058278]|uniref:STAS domain-containing protein n=1 Tax=Amycolatopsis sp. NPDC058278 TaxID=3346417 RepID=UPI0036D9761D